MIATHTVGSTVMTVTLESGTKGTFSSVQHTAPLTGHDLYIVDERVYRASLPPMPPVPKLGKPPAVPMWKQIQRSKRYQPGRRA